MDDARDASPASTTEASADLTPSPVGGAAKNKAPVPALSPPMPAASPWSFGGYGELLVATLFYGPDPNKEYEPGEHDRTLVDVARVVFNVQYDFNDTFSFVTEAEIEHGGTGAAMEVEWDEFGEYEMEVEKGGEFVLEQAYLQAHLVEQPFRLELRVGHLLTAFGTIASHHLPNQFSSARRPEAEEALIPSTWHESGIELAGAYEGFRARCQVVTGLDSTGFSSQNWIAGGTQRRFETVRASDWAVVGRLDFVGFPGLNMGVSGYTSNTTGNRPKRDMEDVDARVWLGDWHVRFHHGPLRLRNLVMVGNLQNADTITEKNGSLSKFLDVPRTPVASWVYGTYVEAALDTLEAFAGPSRYRLDVFARVDMYHPFWRAPNPTSGLSVPLLETRTITAGLNYFPHPRIVAKGNYVSRWLNKDHDWGRRQQELNFALGFVL